DTLEQNLKKQPHLLIRVRDNGPGIAAADRKLVYEPFFSTSAARTGLGLTFCQKTIKQYNGRLNFKTGVNRGTTFYVYLPLK
ncbi:MAG TPA: ATP-binding protein, partial [Spirochaetota bacterium]|nr:ATP-binding protein [Spirochaetota bacterium]